MNLVLTRAHDLHTDLVINSLERKGSQCIRFETPNFPQKVGVTISCPSPGHDLSCLQINGQHIDLGRVRTVWFRRPDPPIPAPSLDAESQEFARSESRLALEALWHLLRDRFWVNPYDSCCAARLKPYQLQVARTVGFRVPRTLITNNPSEAASFFQRCKGLMIYKALNTHSREKRGITNGVYTSAVSESDLTSRLSEISVAPCIFQECIPKKAEFRVTVIGQRIFTVEIQSQETSHSTLDWRRNIGSVSYQSSQLPDFIVVKIHEMLRRMDLVFGCFDFILTPNDEFVFLELNPNGQWYFVEEGTGMPLLDSFTEMLNQGTVHYLSHD